MKNKNFLKNCSIRKYFGVRDVLGIYMKLRYYCGQVRSQQDDLN